MKLALLASPRRFALVRCFLLFASGLLAWSAFAQDPGTGGMPASSFGSSSPPEVRVRPTAIFFPPTPPALDTPVAIRTGPPSYGRQTPPAELAGHVADIFYPQLGSRLTENEMNERARQQLADYLTAKRALLDEIREQLGAAPPDDIVARRTTLEAFARRQSPKIAQLEQQAEQLRVDLAIKDREWGSFRQWHLGDKERRGFSPIEISQTMRGYAYYYKNIPLIHRLLLLEIAVELRLAAETAAAAAAAQQHMFFSPALARVQLPNDTTPEVAAKAAAYQTKKSILKKELYDAVIQEEDRPFFFRSHPLRSTAEKQTAALAELEALAEEIRIGLGSPARSEPVAERSPLPPTMAHRLTELAERRRQVEREASAKIGPLTGRARGLPVSITYRFENDGLHYLIVPRIRNIPDEAATQIENLNRAFATIAATYGQQLAELINQGDAIRHEAADFIGDKTPAAVIGALNRALRIAALAVSASAYREYRLAVFEPGLSPGQRRLLFHAAIEEFDLPLPRGEMQPTVRGSSW